MGFRSNLGRKLIFLAMGVLALYYALVVLFSALFMEPYYLHNVEETLISAYYELNTEEVYSLETISRLEQNNLSIIIADRETDAILYNSQVADRFMPDMMDRVLPFIKDSAQESDTGYSITTDEFKQHTSSGVTYSSGKQVSLGGITPLYIVEISTSYASISQAISISMQFSLIVGLMVMILAILAFSHMSAMVVVPITQITSIANQIAHLDFSQSCDTHTRGEIGDMARSVNTMSDFMQSYINQLQTANDQLIADLQQKKEQDEARRNLVSNLSHDLITPIGLSSGYAAGRRGGMAKTDEEVREYCDVICDESERMMTLILRMMELFRLESGTVQLEIEEFDLADLLDYVVEIFSMELEKAGVQFTAEFSDSLYICTDYFSVEQVVTNYMQNALSHIHGGNEMALTVTDRGDFYRVSVFNSADHIPIEELPRIWDSFYRLDKSRERSSRRSGLGLSIVRRNMELLRGAYGVENIMGGVRFWAEFPKNADGLNGVGITRSE